MFMNNFLTIKTSLLIAMITGVAVISSVITFSVIHMMTPSVSSCPVLTCPNFCQRTSAQEAARKRYFKVHKANLNGERF